MRQNLTGHACVRPFPFVAVALAVTIALILGGCGEVSDSEPVFDGGAAGGLDVMVEAPRDPCADVVCSGGERCTPQTGECSCQAGQVDVGDGCEPIACLNDSDCSDGDACSGQERCNQALNQCEDAEPVVCDGGRLCDASSGACACPAATVESDGECVPVECEADVDCDDGLACNGIETCDVLAGQCAAGEAVSCGQGACAESDELAVCVCDVGYFLSDSGCVAPCPVPWTPLMSVMPVGTTLLFHAQSGFEVRSAIAELGVDALDVALRPAAELALPSQAGLARVVAASMDDACALVDVFDAQVEVVAALPPAAGYAGSDAVAMDDPAIVGWASRYVDVAWGTDVDDIWRTPALALGPATGSTADVVVLGNGGAITLAFDRVIVDGPGADFAVFENAFNDTFLEWAFVEISSDGVHFTRFPSLYRGPRAAGPFAMLGPDAQYGLAGRYRVGFGTPYDLATLRQHPDVQGGRLNLAAVQYVRVVDIIGDGREQDAWGAPIFDPTPVSGSGGFDLEAIAVLNVATP
jgi:hypothetical protein